MKKHMTPSFINFSNKMKYFLQTLHSLILRFELPQLLKGCIPLNKAILFFAVTIIGFLQQASANNISVSNVSTTGQNMSAGVNNAANYSMVKFDLSWENSWRTATGPSNWDAAWVFVKFRVGASDPTFTGVSSSGTTVTVTSTANLRVGMPVRVTSGTGAFAANTVISSITNATQFVVSATPSTPLSSAGIECKRIWEHARLSNTGHTAPGGSTIDAGLLTPGSAFNATTNPALGVFIYRNANGSGTNTYSNTQLRWNYGDNDVKDNAVISVQVFAIEMVYVPQAPFYLGSGGTESGSFTDGSWTSGNTIPFQITSESALGIDNAAGKLWGTSSSGNSTIGNITADAEATLAAAYPKGYAGFYCMKYEISQGGYRDFLNTLTYNQQVNRTPVAPDLAAGTGALSSTNTDRNGLDIQTPGNSTTMLPAVYACNIDGDGNYNETVDGEWIACNFLTWMDGCAYMDWAGLRPMTELEYEKACRGNQAAVTDEYAWGSTSLTRATGISNGGANNETFSNGGANCAIDDDNNGGVPGPLRVGAFAGVATSRAQAGASYYGTMELSGNLWERVVSTGNSDGRNFTGQNGNGQLSANGHANQNLWPGLSSNEVTAATGSGFRGGNWSDDLSYARVSDRWVAASSNSTRYRDAGFRGVRSAQ
jgi:formylglycine-generating enzyme required for sulfatase activity